MKVIILAGGWGTRLGQQTNDIPKPMVKIGSHPIIWHIMNIYSFYGFNEFIVSLGFKAEVIKSYFANYKSFDDDFTVDLKNGNITYHNKNELPNWKITLVDTGLNTLKGARIKRVENYLEDDINMITYGDGVADVNIRDLVKFHKSHGKMLTITGVNPPARFGELVAKKGELISFNEKPQTSSSLINGGFMVFNKSMLDLLNVNPDCDFEYGILEQLTKDGNVMVYEHTKNWECMDHERDVIHLNNLWKSGRAFWKHGNK